jgi:signal transduction histidine kinase
MNQIEAGKRIACAASPSAAARSIHADAASPPPASLVQPAVALAVADPALARQLAATLARELIAPGVAVVPTLARLRESLRQGPAVIALELELLHGAPFLESLHSLAAATPIVLLAAPEFQAELPAGLADIVAAGNLDLILRAGDFLPLAASLIARRCRWARSSDVPFTPPWSASPEIGEILRHEINNPLTGILGNAELVLARRERLLPVQIQRLQTVVDLAVRLRETIRRLSDAWEGAPRAPHSP